MKKKKKRHLLSGCPIRQEMWFNWFGNSKDCIVWRNTIINVYLCNIMNIERSTTCMGTPWPSSFSPAYGSPKSINVPDKRSTNASAWPQTKLQQFASKLIIHHYLRSLVPGQLLIYIEFAFVHSLYKNCWKEAA